MVEAAKPSPSNTPPARTRHPVWPGVRAWLVPLFLWIDATVCFWVSVVVILMFSDPFWSGCSLTTVALHTGKSIAAVIGGGLAMVCGVICLNAILEGTCGEEFGQRLRNRQLRSLYGCAIAGVASIEILWIGTHLSARASDGAAIGGYIWLASQGVLLAALPFITGLAALRSRAIHAAWRAAACAACCLLLIGSLWLAWRIQSIPVRLPGK